MACNVFGAHAHDLYCAVPEDRPVPPFVGGRAWEFAGRLAEKSTVRLPGALTTATRFNGFYIFHPFERPKLLSIQTQEHSSDRAELLLVFA